MKGDILLSDLTFGYQEDTPVLKGMSCIFEENKVTALLGPSGCGKTTLINLIDQIYQPQTGQIQIGRINVREYDLASYRKQISILPQTALLFSGTVRQNLLFGMDQTVSDECLWKSLDQVRLGEDVRRLTGGLDAQIGEHGSSLSGGQRQKLALARLLLQDASYVILDEATASMDILAVQDIREILKDVLKNKTVILIAHTPQLMDLADNAVVIENGAVAAQGEFQSVMKKNAFLNRFMEGEAHA